MSPGVIEAARAMGAGPIRILVTGVIPEALGPEAGYDRAIHFFELPDETVWGATARILVSFLEHLTAAR